MPSPGDIIIISLSRSQMNPGSTSKKSKNKILLCISPNYDFLIVNSSTHRLGGPYVPVDPADVNPTSKKYPPIKHISQCDLSKIINPGKAHVDKELTKAIGDKIKATINSSLAAAIKTEVVNAKTLTKAQQNMIINNL